jgi:hypothetical protein
MKYLALCIMLWMAHITINALTDYARPRELGMIEKRNACIDLFASAESWKYTLWGRK